ncbi:hypothetical protein [Pseudarthrobacter sp. C4D7]|uniref:hypothetical protein n=1 Tax=Pseudarthrobacter sp. C4D7 TaxID=2735268 RepID=UPI00158542DB|nr:hypothetical protein [Pseudarthrobacter sp. C4D7]
MVQLRSENSVSRTGIHGGVRRGTAAAAVGAVLVLSTGVQASLADDAVPPPQYSSTQDAARRGGQGTGAPTAPAQHTPSSLLPLPSLIPTISASLSAGTASTPSSAPTASGTPFAPRQRTTPPDAPSGSAHADAPATPAASPAPSGPGAGPTPSAGPTTGTAAVPGSPSPAQAVLPPAGGMPSVPAPGGSVPAPGAQQAVPGSGGAPAGVAPAQDAAVSGGVTGTDSTPAPVLPTSLSINARQSQPTRAPQAAGVPAGPGRAVSSTEPLPEVPDAMVWLGAGLVGVGAAAGLVFLRLRRP